MAEGYLLTEQDRTRIQEALALLRRMTQNTRNRPAAQVELGQSPDVYIVKTPAGGIPGFGTPEAAGTGTEVD